MSNLAESRKLQYSTTPGAPERQGNLGRKRIEIEYSEDAMFGNNPANRDNVDIPASFAAWEKMLTAELATDYPDAEITIANTINDKHSAQFADGFRDDISTVSVGETIHRVWQSWKWALSN